MAKTVSTSILALQALSRVLADPSPKALHGTKGKGIFEGSGQAAKEAARYCLERGWLQTTGQFEGKGKSRKELYRISAAGLKEVLQNSEPVVLLRDSLASLDRSSQELVAIRTRVDEALEALKNQKAVAGVLQERLHPPDLERVLERLQSSNGSSTRPAGNSTEWLASALNYLDQYRQRNPYGHCPLPELFRGVAEPRGLTIGQFHDGLRALVERQQVRLHAYTGAAYQLKDEQYALVAGQEIKYYAERLARST